MEIIGDVLKELYPEEIWKDCPGYEGLYLVSNYGNIKRPDKHDPSQFALKKIQDNGNGYKLCQFFKDKGKAKNFYIHRLVATVFIHNPDFKKEVNHKDGNKANNHFLNLEWCTRSYNVKHAFANGFNYHSEKQKINSAIGRGLALSKPVRHLESGAVFVSILSAAKSMKVSYAGLKKRLGNGTEKKFEYAERKRAS